MLRGNRLYIVALGLILCGAKPPQEQPQSQTSAQPAEQATAEPYAPYAGYDPDPCYQAKDHDAADLCAQWRASIAAEKAANEAGRATDWAIVATFLSAIGLGAIVVSLRQTNRSLRIAQRDRATATRRAVASGDETKAAMEIARKNAAATEQSVAETRRIGEAQVRCYPTTISAEIGHASLNFVAIKIVVKNTGLSPAKNVTFSAYLTQLVSSDTLITSTKNPNCVEVEIDIPAGEQDNLTGSILFEPRYDIPKPADSPYHVLITLVINITCKDVFGLDVHQTDKFSAFLHAIPTVETKWVKLDRDSRVKLRDGPTAT